MTADHSTLPRPSWEEFEHMVADIARMDSHSADVSLYARKGQEDHGVDVYSSMNSNGDICGYQAKRRSEANSISESDIDEEISSAEAFEPSLSKYVIMTTAQQDKPTQDLVRRKSNERVRNEKFPVDINMWGDISRMILFDQRLEETHYPDRIDANRRIQSQGVERLSPHTFRTCPWRSQRSAIEPGSILVRSVSTELADTARLILKIEPM